MQNRLYHKSIRWINILNILFLVKYFVLLWNYDHKQSIHRLFNRPNIMADFNGSRFCARRNKGKATKIFCPLKMRWCLFASRYSTTCFLLVWNTKFVVDNLGSDDAPSRDWSPWFQLLPCNNECECVCVCVRLRVVKHSNTGRLRQEGTVRSAQLHGHLTGTVIRAKAEDIFELLGAHKPGMDVWWFHPAKIEDLLRALHSQFETQRCWMLWHYFYAGALSTLFKKPRLVDIFSF